MTTAVEQIRATLEKKLNAKLPTEKAVKDAYGQVLGFSGDLLEREWALAQGEGDGDLPDPVYDAWDDTGTKSTVVVRPYTREGHLVHGYTREQEIGDMLAALRQDFGRPLGLPTTELHQAERATSSGRVAEQVEAITRRLEAMKSGDEIEITASDVSLLSTGPEAAGIVSNLAGTYRRVDNEWHKVTRIGKHGPDGIQWEDRLENSNRTEGDARNRLIPKALSSEEFAKQYRGALLRPLGIGEFSFKHPSMDQIAAWLDDRYPVGSTISLGDEGMKLWWQDANARKGVYLHKLDGWHHYESFDDMTPPGSDWTEGYSNAPDGTWLHGTSTRELVPFMEHRFVDEMRSEHSNKAAQTEWDVFTAAVEGNVNADDYTIGSSPGEFYRKQHRALMEAGALIDGEVQQAFKDAGIPADEEARQAEDAYAAANGRMRELLTAQHDMAEQTARDVLTAQLGSLGLETPKWARGRTRWPGNTHSIHKDLVYHADEYEIGQALELFLNRARTAERDNGATFPPETQALLTLQNERGAAWYDRLKEFSTQTTEIIDKRIAMEADRQNLIEPLAIAKDEAYAAGDRKDLIRGLRKQRGPLVLQVLSRHRPMGGELKITNPRRTKGIESVIDAAKWLPTAWVEASNPRPPTVKTKTTERAKYTTQDGMIQTDGSPGTSLHELVHHMEHVVRPLSAAQWTFWHRRARGNNFDAPFPTPKWIGAGKRSEVAVEDDFKEVYSGKVYGGGTPVIHWELLSMGIPSLFGLEYPEVTWADDDYRKFVLGAMMLI